MLGWFFNEIFFRLQIGDHVGYQDLDSQRKSERNYKFSFDQSSLTINDGLEDNKGKNGEERDNKVKDGEESNKVEEESQGKVEEQKGEENEVIN